MHNALSCLAAWLTLRTGAVWSQHKAVLLVEEGCRFSDASLLGANINETRKSHGKESLQSTWRE